MPGSDNRFHSFIIIILGCTPVRRGKVAREGIMVNKRKQLPRHTQPIGDPAWPLKVAPDENLTCQPISLLCVCMRNIS